MDFWASLTQGNMLHYTYFAGIAGLLTHLLLSHGEWDHATHILLPFWLVAFLSTTYVIVFLQIVSLAEAVHACYTFALVYFGTLASSIVIYRAFFHRLHKVSFSDLSSIENKLIFSVPRTITSTTVQILFCLPSLEIQPPILQGN